MSHVFFGGIRLPSGPAVADATIDGAPHARVDDMEPSRFPGHVRVRVQGVWSTVPTSSLVPVIPLTLAPVPIPWGDDGCYGDAYRREDEEGVSVRLPCLTHHFFALGTPPEVIDDIVRRACVAYYTHQRDEAVEQLKLWE